MRKRWLITPEQAAPLAIIAHELVTNALKHGRPGGGSVALRLHQLGDAWCLTVTDPGELPPGFDPASGAGFGLVMANACVRPRAIWSHFGSGEVELSVVVSSIRPGADLAPAPPSLRGLTRGEDAQAYGVGSASPSTWPRRCSCQATSQQSSAQLAPSVQPASTSDGQWTPR